MGFLNKNRTCTSHQKSYVQSTISGPIYLLVGGVHMMAACQQPQHHWGGCPHHWGVRHPPPPVCRSLPEHHLSLSDALSGARIPRNPYNSTPFFQKSFHSVRTELMDTKIGNHPNPPMILPVTFVQCLFPVILAHSGPAWAFGGGGVCLVQCFQAEIAIF